MRRAEAQAALASIVESAVTLAAGSPDGPTPSLEPAEAALVATACAERQREFAFGRASARAALRAHGAPVVAIPVGPRREPQWPAGIVGSITHCDGFCAAAVASSDTVAGLGIDAEVAGALPDGTAALILDAEERAWLRGREHALQMVFFSAKESVYKCLAPLTGLFLDFRDATLTLDLAAATFVASIRHPACPIRRLAGRFALAGGLVLTSVAYRASFDHDDR
ncbi:MAG: 4'-phosphopantetheinyl transferase [Lautropia sp.]